MRRLPHLKPAASAASIALALVLALMLGLATSLAGRGDGGRPGDAAAGAGKPSLNDERFSPSSSYFYWQRTPLPTPQFRPPGLSPFGDQFRRAETPGDTRGRVVTSLGALDLRNPHLLDALPPGLRRAAALSRPGRGGLAIGPNLVQIAADALRDRADEVASELAKGGRVVGLLPERAFVVLSGSRQQLERMAALPYVEAMSPYLPGLKIERSLGRSPMIQEGRAKSHTLNILVTAWPGATRDEIDEMRRGLEAIVGARAVADFSGDGTVLSADAPADRVAQIAAIDSVQAVQESSEWVLANSEAPTVVMTGSLEDTLGARPYHDIGIDGGGLDTNADGERVNDGSDTIPPQIVAVTDNGISYDSVQFSQSLTAPTDANHIIGPNHRKIQAIQTVLDDGTSCDGVLFGAGTHGNVVAGAIAGWPTGVGAFASKTVGIGTPPLVGVNLDGVARGARIIMQDCARTDRCTFNDLIEKGGNVVPGNIATRLRDAMYGGNNVHLHVLPFGIPNFGGSVNDSTNGTYSIEAAQIDTFLVNNRDYMVFVPVGNKGAIPTGPATRRYPDLFNGTAVDNDPNHPMPLQVSPPATAKDIVSVGGHREDMQSLFGTFNMEEVPSAFSSRGPATTQSLRMAPLLMSVAEDWSGIFDTPGTQGVAVFRSRDVDNVLPVEAQLDELNTGTSFAAAYVTGAGALVRDYFEQGFYPTGNRSGSNRMPNVSGALVKAMLVASANFLEQSTFTDAPTDSDRFVAQARAIYSTSGTQGCVGAGTVGVIGNNEQGYGRVQLSNVLPIPNWPPARPIGAPDTLEYPAAGLLVYDDIGTGEAVINNSTNTSVTRTFTVSSANTVGLPGGGRAVSIGSLRIALAWPDPPSLAVTSDGTLMNDLDLEVESPGPDNCLTAKLCAGGPSPGAPCAADADCGTGGTCSVTATRPDGTACPVNSAADNLVYDGNVYVPQKGVKAGQWSQGRAKSGQDLGDTRNPVEAVHLSSDPNGDRDVSDSQLDVGTWRVTVKHGSCGAVPGAISQIDGPNEDADGDFRIHLGTCSIPAQHQCINNRDCDVCSQSGTTCASNADCGGGTSDLCQSGGVCVGAEDLNGNGLLDAGGQPYALVVAGPVLGSGSQTWGGTQHVLPRSQVRLDKATYGCADDVVVQVFDPDATLAAVPGNITLSVLDAAGNVVDTERGFAFSEVPPGSHAFFSVKVPVRQSSPSAVKNNGLLETDTGQFILVDYADTPVAGQARATVRCNPDLVAGLLQTQNQTDGAVLITGGCDRDPFPDAGEDLTYTIALMNTNRGDDYTEVVATLSASGPGATAVRVLDSPKPIGRLPGGQVAGISFSLHVDTAAANALSIDQRSVTLNLTLDSTNRNKVISRQSFSFTHPINADKEILHYSTDFPAGGREVRDLNRNLQIDVPDSVDPFTHILVPDEDITFSSLFYSDAGVVRNTVGEDLNRNGQFDDYDVVPDRQLDLGILASSTGTGPTDKVPFTFDRNDGGFTKFRHPSSETASTVPGNLWEYQTSGLCGFQTAIADGNPLPFFQNGGAGIWHTGDGDPTTPGASATGCDNYAMPTDPSTPVRAEKLLDILESPIIAKVHQTPDARGFPYSVEFQRLAMNVNMQTVDGVVQSYAGGYVNFDSDIDNDNPNCLLCQNLIYPRFGGSYYNVARLYSYYYGIDPRGYSDTKQRTFGPLVDPDRSMVLSGTITGDETGFSGFTSNTNKYSTSPIPTAPPDFLPYPTPSRICSNSPTTTCTVDANCPVGGVCVLVALPKASDGTPVSARAAGPTRNLDVDMVDYNDGLTYLETGVGAFEPDGFFTPGPAGNRWQFAIGFFVFESPNLITDYGLSIDDPVLEWDEIHPLDESQFNPPHTPACQRLGQPGQAAGAQCATLVVDRTNLYECDDAITVTVHDPKRTGIGSVSVLAASESDSQRISTGVGNVSVPVKPPFPLPEISPGVFQGTITVTSQANNPGTLFVTPATDQQITVYYMDKGVCSNAPAVTCTTNTQCPTGGTCLQCDGDADGQPGEYAFDNLDGDGLIPGVCSNALTTNCTASAQCPAGGTCQCPPGLTCPRLDNCPFVYNPTVCVNDPNPDPQKKKVCTTGTDCAGTTGPCAQFDSDGDGVGEFCDDCPSVYDPAQADFDGDGVGDLCDLDDIDFDGVPNGSDNCPDVYNPLQVPAGPQNPRGDACNQTSDRDNDGVQDKSDNCVRVYNPDQHDADGDGIGDACDGDCQGAHKIDPLPSLPLGSGSCSRSSSISCNANSDCPSTGTCSNNGARLCVGNNDCPGGTCVNPTPEVCVRAEVVNNVGVCSNAPSTRCTLDAQCPSGGTCGTAALCSTVNDDVDLDLVTDTIDNCPAIYNPAVIAGTNRQKDSDRDGLGDECDPVGSWDDDNSGVPDDILSYSLVVSCRVLPLARIVVKQVVTGDINGDHDPFPDSGETARLFVTVQNIGDTDLTNVNFNLNSADDHVACITRPSIFRSAFHAGETLVLGTMGPTFKTNPQDYTGDYFEVVVNRNLQSASGSNPAFLNLVLTLTSSEVLGTIVQVPVRIVADIDLPASATGTILPRILL